MKISAKVCREMTGHMNRGHSKSTFAQNFQVLTHLPPLVRPLSLYMYYSLKLRLL